MMKDIKKEDIPEWEYGDVVIKSFSFGEKFEIANVKAKMSKDESGKLKDAEMVNAEIDVAKLSIKSLASGLHSVKTREGQFIIRPGSLVSERETFAYKVEFESGKYLLERVQELNSPITEDDIKNSKKQAPEKKT